MDPLYLGFPAFFLNCPVSHWHDRLTRTGTEGSYRTQKKPEQESERSRLLLRTYVLCIPCLSPVDLCVAISQMDCDVATCPKFVVAFNRNYQHSITYFFLGNLWWWPLGWHGPPHAESLCHGPLGGSRLCEPHAREDTQPKKDSAGTAGNTGRNRGCCVVKFSTHHNECLDTYSHILAQTRTKHIRTCWRWMKMANVRSKCGSCYTQVPTALGMISLSHRISPSNCCRRALVSTNKAGLAGTRTH